VAGHFSGCAGDYGRVVASLPPPPPPPSGGFGIRGSSSARIWCPPPWIYGGAATAATKARASMRVRLWLRQGPVRLHGRGGEAGRLLQLPFLRIRPFRGYSCCRPCGSGRNSPVRAAVEGRGGVTSGLPVLFVLDVGEHRRKAMSDLPARRR